MITLRPTLAATVLVAVLATTWTAARPSVPAPPDIAPPVADRPDLSVLPELSPVYAEAADALRRRDCGAALARIEPLTHPDAADPAFARVVSGLYAHACENVELARERLFLGGGRGTPLEDWRLLVLADSAAATGELPVARAAVEKILEGDDRSPLLFQALDAAVRRAWAAGDADRALELVERARRAEERLTRPWRQAEETVKGLDLLAFEIATEAGREDARRTAVRRLVVRTPVIAREEGISAMLRDETGTVPWRRVLSPSELVERAGRLLAAGEPQPAIDTFQAVPAAARDLDWYLLTADALTRAERGGEALALLSELTPADPVRLARVEWARAAAVQEMATARRGRQNLPSERRQALQRQYREHLERVARLDDGELAREALREIFAELIHQERFEQGLEVLQALKDLDPADETGAAFLWQRGWSAYQRRNWSGAVGYWAELAALYPDSRYHRSGHYWSGRAYEALGDRERARRIYGDIAAADTSDFYRRYALARLGRPPLAEPAEPRLSWPTDPMLARARLLSDLGLDDLAATELAQVAERADPRAVAALESLILARDGDPRRSIGRIRDAFPALGTPHQSGVPAEALRLYYPLAYLDEIRASAERAGLSLPLVLGMIRQESGFDATATSRAGARGLMQLMPATGREVAQRIGLSFSPPRLEEPSYNTRLGTTYFQQVLSMFDGNVELALAGYNGGPYRIKRLWREAGHGELDRFLEGLPVEESRIYVKRILLLSDSYRQVYDLSG